MHLQEKALFDFEDGSNSHETLHHVTYTPAKFEVATSNHLEDAFTRKNII